MHNSEQEQASKLKLIVIGASSGGLAALETLLSALPEDFPCPIALVQHLSPHRKSQLVDILSRQVQLRVCMAEHLQRIEAGSIYIAPPDYHLQVTSYKTLRLTQSPKIHFSRPAIDVLFESAADAYGASAIAIILTGSNDDGKTGMQAIKQAGGLTIVQSPESAESPRMPQAAIDGCKIDWILPLEAIAPHLCQLLNQDFNKD